MSAYDQAGRLRVFKAEHPSLPHAVCWAMPCHPDGKIDRQALDQLLEEVVLPYLRERCSGSELVTYTDCFEYVTDCAPRSAHRDEVPR